MEPNDTNGAMSPPLLRDRAYWGMTGTQFFGAFNDNLFKQLVLLICVTQPSVTKGEDFYQPLAMAVFSAPFLLFSGFAGWLSDRLSKRGIVIGCKVAEILIMLLGMVAFLQQSLFGLFIVLFLMGSHSAFFGPSKYGILPELFRERDLPLANGIIQMTTFLAIILGTALAGLLREWFPDTLWLASLACIVLALIGTWTASLLRPTQPLAPRLRFEGDCLILHRETRLLLFQDRRLLLALVVSSLFWMVAGVVQAAVNYLGKQHLFISDSETSLLNGFVALGIVIGFVTAGKLAQGSIPRGFVTYGAWGLILNLLLLGGAAFDPHPDYSPGNPSSQEVAPANLPEKNLEMDGGGVESEPHPHPHPHPRARFWAFVSGAELFLLGVSAAFFALPLQVFTQTRPPKEQKGRVIGALNVFNFTGIFLSAAFYGVCNKALAQAQIPPVMVFGLTATLLVPVALFYRLDGGDGSFSPRGKQSS